MRLGICTIQRDRAPWIKEWVAFHYLVGFRKFYFFAHNCKDNTSEVLLDLQRKFDIQAFVIGADVERPQLKSYQYAYDNFAHEVDWMAFIDGDEFLFPTRAINMSEALEGYSYEKISALGVWWSCFGSSGHIQEPEGLVIENYRMRASQAFEANHHIKSIVLGRQMGRVHVAQNAHIFNTPFGTVDEQRRIITKGCIPEYEPSYDCFRINHYVCQSYEYFKDFKKHSGAADAGALMVRPDAWWARHDRNDEVDYSMQGFVSGVRELLDGL